MMKVKRCLYFLFTNEDNVVVINDYDDVVDPYIEKCHLRKDAPQEIKGTYKKIQVKLDELKMQTFDLLAIGEKKL